MHKRHYTLFASAWNGDIIIMMVMMITANTSQKDKSVSLQGFLWPSALSSQSRQQFPLYEPNLCPVLRIFKCRQFM